ncbi:hypothetical protein CPB84DRAFT_847715 [Gymnopilus junonius]|uniref:Uncharacterized protein n=1 Tax=Gymnopilus junonius TaxID=109634 RepID=A0A9P5NMY5_GYMJU|nr:hypothetical protein CPB84DRAFT_847715 [Gymnopilus junonius]
MSTSRTVPTYSGATSNKGLSCKLRKKARYQPKNPFVPPSLLATLSGVLSRHVFHDRLERIHCNKSLYPHYEEGPIEITSEKALFLEEEIDDMEWMIPEVEAVLAEPSPAVISHQFKPEKWRYRVRPNRGRLSSSRWSYTYEAQIYNEDYEWEEVEEVGARPILAGSCMAIVSLVVLSIWAITAHIAQ